MRRTTIVAPTLRVGIAPPQVERGGSRKTPRGAWGLLCILICLPAAAVAQVHDGLHGTLPSSERELFQRSLVRSARLIPESKEVAFVISTRSEEAQAFFNQGLAFLYSSWPQEAERAFHTAHQFDPAAAMPQWGIAVSHLLREPKNAVYWLNRLQDSKGGASPLSEVEGALLQTLPHAGAVKDKEERSWRVQMASDLKSVIVEFPGEPEPKAILARLLSDAWYPYLETLGETSDSVLVRIAEILETHPDHPAQRFGLDLWSHRRRHDAYRTPKAYFDTKTLQLSPVYASHWNLASVYLSDRGQFREAVMHSEAAARIHHRWAAQEHSFPDQFPNYARHRATQVRQLQAMGNAEAAISLAHELLRLPRHPVWNSPGKSFGSAFEGRKALLDCYCFFGLWDELDVALRDGRIQPLEAPLHQAEHAYAQAIAAYFLDDAAACSAAGDQLQTIAREVQAAFGARQAGPGDATEGAHDGIDQWLLDGGEEYLSVMDWNSSLEALRLFESGDGERAGNILAGCRRVPHLLRARLMWSIGARQLARQALLNCPQLPMDMRVAAVQPSEGSSASDKFPLQPDPDFADTTRSREPGALQSMGLSAWEPQSLPPISIPLLDGGRLTNESLKGKHTALILFYGGDCWHCVDQLKAVHKSRVALEAAGLQVVAIARQSEDELADWVGEPDQIPFPVVFGCDPTDEVFHSLGAYDDFLDMPHHALVYVDPEGRILWHDISDSPFMDLNFFVEETLRLRTLYPAEDGRRQDIAEARRQDAPQ